MAVRGILLVLLGLSLADETALASSPVIDWVLDRGDKFLAATNGGLYQALKTDQVWNKIDSVPVLKGMTGIEQNSSDPNELIYFSHANAELLGGDLGWGKEAEISNDAGKTWRPLKVPGIVTDIFLHPSGSIFAAESTISTTVQPDAGYFQRGTSSTRYYVTNHLVVSEDQGSSWREITPDNLARDCSIEFIFQDPDHPSLVCISATRPWHAGRVWLYQAIDSTYHWKQLSPFQDDNDRFEPDFPLNFGSYGGTNNSDMPANLDNFFKFPFSRSGPVSSIPTRYFGTDKPSYVFHLHQPMVVTVTTVWMFSNQPPLHVVDDPDEKRFWSIAIKSPHKRMVVSDYPVDELNFGYRDQKDRIAAYLHNPKVTNAFIDQAHPYRRVLDLDKLFPFWAPGKYQVIATYSNASIIRDGCIMGTPAFDVTILP